MVLQKIRGRQKSEFYLKWRKTPRRILPVHWGILVLYRSIAVLNLRLKGCQEYFFNRTEHPALLNVCRAKGFIQSRLQCLTFLICILTTGWWSSGCGPCVSACGLYHCWHELLLWSASVLPSTVQTCRADASRETMGFPLGLEVWDWCFFHRSFIGCLKLLSSLAGLFQGQAGCRRTCLGGVAFASVRAWLGVTVLSFGKHVLVAEVFSLPSAGHPAKENGL